jgi:hypothetical protein
MPTTVEGRIALPGGRSGTRSWGRPARHTVAVPARRSWLNGQLALDLYQASHDEEELRQPERIEPISS